MPTTLPVRKLTLVLLMLLASGMASLLYQVTWLRLIGFSFGSTSASISTVLSAFFLGLALGSYLADRISEAGRGSFLPYLVLEGVIGVFGLLSLPLLLNLDQMVVLAPVLGDSLVVKFLLAVLLLIIPASCMGATFPVMAAIVVRDAKAMGGQIGVLYGVNTLGAVIGAFAGGFFVIPTIGLDGAILLAAGLNISVALVALFLWLAERGSFQPPTGVAPTTRRETRVMTGRQPVVWLAAVTLFATGFVSIAIQVAWTKYLAIFTGNTIFGFSIILTVFLFGLAAGSLLFRRIGDRFPSASVVLPVLLFLIALTMLTTRWGLSMIPMLQSYLNKSSLTVQLESVVRYGVTLILLFPPTFLLGMTFPVSLKAFCFGLEGVQKRIGKGYAINTVAGIAGALVAGFVAIPLFGTDMLLVALVLVTLVAGFMWLPIADSRSSLLVSGILAAVTIGAAIVLPGLDYRSIVANVGYHSRSKAGEVPEFHFLEEGKAGVISLISYDDRFFTLQNNGLNESSLEAGNKDYSLRSEFLLGVLPYIFADDAKSAFVVGFGAGHTTRALFETPLEQIDVVELEPAVVRASRSVDSFVDDVLEDPRVNLRFNDARNELLLSKRSFDIIVSQPSHPWTSGAANVFTRQFWEITSRRLKPGGVMAQWVNLFLMDTVTLKAIMAAFFDVYPQGYVFADIVGGDIVLVGSNDRLKLDLDRANRVLASGNIGKLARRVKAPTADDIVWYFALTAQEAADLSSDTVPSLDTNIITEVRLSSRRTVEPGSENDPNRFLKENRSDNYAAIIDVTSAEKLERLADYFLRWKVPARAIEIAGYLESVNPAEANRIRHAAFLQGHRYSQAIELFASRDDWDAQTVIAQIKALLQIGWNEEALKLASGLPDSFARQNLVSESLYRLGRTDEVITLNRFNRQAGGVWHLLSLAEEQPDLAAGLLVGIDSIPESARMDVTTLFLRTNAEKGRMAEVTRLASALGGILESKLGDLTKIANIEENAGKVGDAVNKEIRRLKSNHGEGKS